MARTKAFDPNEVLLKALGVFGNLGYEGTSLPDLLKGLGIARQSMYDTYGTKRNLFLAAVKHYMDSKLHDLLELTRQPGSAEERITLIFERIIDILDDPALRQDCFIISSAIEQAPRDPELAAYLLANDREVELGFEKLLYRGQENGEWNKDLNISELACFLTHERNALVLTAKLGADRAKLERIVRTSLSVLRLAKSKME
ncbi:TetR/AcrR family transcriptional regulator [Saccharibacillus sp. JS10]|uniref:TetR/AcrR family transcriptional regulator n=1 Tax=Saccharibacillus sp. JS10 TaxID=2950552 RepID=UPI00210CFE9A|nr:TetR family transcriptional regulator [Saccharibacillus sp. JS10]MCQ4088646.1 TetR/AcrR family transcriptional regulator [Saccharibacillus sp. JS10]